MTDQYNLCNLEATYKKYLFAGNKKLSTIKNYLSDFRHFIGWLISFSKTFPLKINNQKIINNTNSINELHNYFSPIIFSYYFFYLNSNNIPTKTINRRISSLHTLCKFLIAQGLLFSNPINNISKFVNCKNLTFGNKIDLSHFKRYLQNQLTDDAVEKCLLDIQEFFTITS